MRYPRLLTEVFLNLIQIDRCRLMIAFSLISVSCHLGFSTNPAQSFPSKEVSLADWGLSHPSQIGHLSIGILHKKKGDEVVLYDVRERKNRF